MAKKYHITSKQNTRPNFIDIFFSYTFLRFIPAYITPNIITGFRFLALPFIVFFLVNNQNDIATIIFCVAALSDALDGALARTTDQITDWGKMYDPLADKLLIGTTAAIVVTKYISPLLAYAMILIEVVLILHAYYKREIKGKVIQAIFIGKIKMIFQSVGMIALLLFIAGVPWAFLLPTATYILCAALVLGALSLIVYRSI